MCGFRRCLVEVGLDLKLGIGLKRRFRFILADGALCKGMKNSKKIANQDGMCVLFLDITHEHTHAYMHACAHTRIHKYTYMFC